MATLLNVTFMGKIDIIIKICSECYLSIDDLRLGSSNFSRKFKKYKNALTGL